jgi:hypothetical protein
MNVSHHDENVSSVMSEQKSDNFVAVDKPLQQNLNLCQGVLREQASAQILYGIHACTADHVAVPHVTTSRDTDPHCPDPLTCPMHPGTSRVRAGHYKASAVQPPPMIESNIQAQGMRGFVGRSERHLPSPDSPAS